jgi:hypothetical protein
MNGQEIAKQMESLDGIARNLAHISVNVAPIGSTGENLGESMIRSVVALC